MNPPIIASVFLAFVLSAHGSSVELPIAPNQLEQQNHKFTIDAHVTNQAVAFHIVITANTNEIPSDSEANLGIVTHEKDSQGAIRGTSITHLQPAVHIALKKDKHVWTADFTLSRDALNTPGVCFIFSELAHINVNGKSVSMPSITFYEIELKEFVKH